MPRIIKATRTEAEWDRRYSVKRPIWSSKASPALMSYLSSHTPGRALDLGAGEGRNAIWLARHGWDVTAVDFSSVALAKAREFAAEVGISDKIDFVLADATRFTPTEPSYDLVCLMYLHLSRRNMPIAVRTAVEALRPEGVFVLLGHDETNIEHGFGGPQDPEILYGPDDIVEAAGPTLQITDAKRIIRTVERSSGPLIAIDCWVTGVRLAHNYSRSDQV